MKFSFKNIPPIDRDCQGRLSIRILLIIIIVLGACLRFAYLSEIQDNPMPIMTSRSTVFDQCNFVSLAKDILEHKWIGSKIIMQSPAYSYLITVLFSIFGKNLNWVFIFQMLLGILGVYIFYRATSLLFENKKVGLIAAFIAAFYSPFLFYECAVLRASSIANINLLAFYFLLKAIRKNKIKHFLLAGFLIGLSAAIRPNVLALLIPYVLVVIKKNFKYRILYALLITIGITLAVSPLAIRNRALGTGTLISTSDPNTFWCGNAYDSKGIGTTRTPYHAKLSNETQGRITGTIKVLWREINRYPEIYRSLYGRKFKMFFNGYEVPANLSYDLTKRDSRILKISFFNFVIISPLAILGFFLALGRYRHGSLLYMFFLILSFFVILFHIQSRYRIPAIPFHLIFAAYSLYWFSYMIRVKKYSALCFGALALGAIFLFTKPDYEIIKRYYGRPIRDIDYSNLADAYIFKYERVLKNPTQEQKRELLAKALENYKEAVAFSSIFRKGNNFLKIGSIYLEMGRHKEALDAFYRVLIFQPNNITAINYIKFIEDYLERQKTTSGEP